jgi:hypothetical protein
VFEVGTVQASAALSKTAADAECNFEGEFEGPAVVTLQTATRRGVNRLNHWSIWFQLRIGSPVAFSGVLEIDARLERIRSHYAVTQDLFAEPSVSPKAESRR